VGATGTGKTFLATVAALRCLYNRKNPVRKIYIIRPAVAAQEDIGFLPGDVSEKLAYFIAPVFDHIAKLVGEEELNKLIEKRKVEVLPIGFLRGRNFEDCCVIFDEAQNANKDQLLLTITRIAQNSKIIICGDPQQLDIHAHHSGLIDALPRFIENPDPDIGVITLPESEIQRHPLVARILERYKEPALTVKQDANDVSLNGTYDLMTGFFLNETQ
jgi:phosphate starvation-inducible PhoH-like protein